MSDEIMTGNPESQPPIVPGAAPLPPAEQAAAVAPVVEAPQSVEYTVAGKTFKVDPELAQALRAREIAYSPPPPPPPSPPAATTATDPEAELDNLWYTNPRKAAELIRNSVKQEIYREYQAEQSQRQFWSQFYESNPDLVKADSFVKATLNQYASMLAPLDVATGQAKLAELTRTSLLAATQGFRQNVPAATPALAESPSTPGARPSAQAAEPAEPAPMTLSETLRARRKARQAVLQSGRAQQPE